MDEQILQKVFEELFQSLETSETQSAAILQFLKAKGIATDEDMAPHLEQASKASSVRWVATRARINRLLSAAAKPPEKTEPPANSETKEPDKSDSQSKQSEESASGSADKSHPETSNQTGTTPTNEKKSEETKKETKADGQAVATKAHDAPPQPDDRGNTEKTNTPAIKKGQAGSSGNNTEEKEISPAQHSAKQSSSK